MINLLPNETKAQLRAAHTNVTLAKYMGILGIALIFLAMACGVSYLFLANNQAVKNKLEDNAQSTTFSYNIAQKKLTSIQSSITTAQTILSHQISYSDIITGIAAALPSGIVLDKLVLDNSTMGAPVTITAHARTSDNIPQLKDNFSRSPLFSNYNLQSTTNDGALPGFPVVINISLVINKGVAL